MYSLLRFLNILTWSRCFSFQNKTKQNSPNSRLLSSILFFIVFVVQESKRGSHLKAGIGLEDPQLLASYASANDQLWVPLHVAPSVVLLECPRFGISRLRERRRPQFSYLNLGRHTLSLLLHSIC